MNDKPSPESLHPRVLAHLGDGVYELHVREMAIAACSQQVEALHQYTTHRANASFQVQLLREITPFLTESELEIVRRGRNVSVTTSRRSKQSLSRQSTSFEALIGFLYLKNPERLKEIWSQLQATLVSGVVVKLKEDAVDDAVEEEVEAEAAAVESGLS
jgi:ribonuclease III family protein